MCLLPDQEVAQSLRLLGLHRDVVHDGLAGAVAGPLHQAVDVPGWSFENRLDPAVAKIAHPPAHPVLRHPPARVTEAHALNLTGVLRVTRHKHAVSLIVSMAGTVILWLPEATS